MRHRTRLLKGKGQPRDVFITEEVGHEEALNSQPVHRARDMPFPDRMAVLLGCVMNDATRCYLEAALVGLLELQPTPTLLEQIALMSIALGRPADAKQARSRAARLASNRLVTASPPEAARTAEDQLVDMKQAPSPNPSQVFMDACHTDMASLESILGPHHVSCDQPQVQPDDKKQVISNDVAQEANNPGQENVKACSQELLGDDELGGACLTLDEDEDSSLLLQSLAMHPAMKKATSELLMRVQEPSQYDILFTPFAEQIKDVNIIGIYKSVLSSDGATHERMFTPYPMEDAVPKVLELPTKEAAIPATAMSSSLEVAPTPVTTLAPIEQIAASVTLPPSPANGSTPAAMAASPEESTFSATSPPLTQDGPAPAPTLASDHQNAPPATTYPSFEESATIPRTSTSFKGRAAAAVMHQAHEDSGLPAELLEALEEAYSSMSLIFMQHTHEVCPDLSRPTTGMEELPYDTACKQVAGHFTAAEGSSQPKQPEAMSGGVIEIVRSEVNETLAGSRLENDRVATECPANVADLSAGPAASSIRMVLSAGAVTQDTAATSDKDQTKELYASLSSPADTVGVEATKVADSAPASNTAVSKKDKKRKKEGGMTAANATLVVGDSAALLVDLVAPPTETLSPFAACKADSGMQASTKGKKGKGPKKSKGKTPVIPAAVEAVVKVVSEEPVLPTVEETSPLAVPQVEDKVPATESDTKTTTVDHIKHKHSAASKNQKKKKGKGKGKGQGGQSATTSLPLMPDVAQHDAPAAVSQLAEPQMLSKSGHDAVADHECTSVGKEKNAGRSDIPTPATSKASVMTTATTATIAAISDPRPNTDVTRDSQVLDGNTGIEHSIPKNKGNAKKGDSSSPAAQPAAVQRQQNTNNWKNVVKSQTPPADATGKMKVKQQPLQTQTAQQQPKHVSKQATKQPQQGVQDKAQRPAVPQASGVPKQAWPQVASSKPAHQAAKAQPTAQPGHKAGHATSNQMASRAAASQAGATSKFHKAQAGLTTLQGCAAPSKQGSNRTTKPKCTQSNDTMKVVDVLKDGSCLYHCVRSVVPSHLRSAIGLPTVCNNIFEDVAALRARAAETLGTPAGLVAFQALLNLHNNAEGKQTWMDDHVMLQRSYHLLCIEEAVKMAQEEFLKPTEFAGEVDVIVLQHMLKEIGINMFIASNEGQQSTRLQLRSWYRAQEQQGGLVGNHFVVFLNENNAHYQFHTLNKQGCMSREQVVEYINQRDVSDWQTA